MLDLGVILKAGEPLFDFGVCFFGGANFFTGITRGSVRFVVN